MTTDKDIIYKLLIIIVVFAGITLVGTYLINLADSKITKQLDYLDQKVIKIIDYEGGTFENKVKNTSVKFDVSGLDNN